MNEELTNKIKRRIVDWN